MLFRSSGFAAEKREEKKIADAAAKLTSALAGATVPKINVITGKAVGSAYAVMNAKGQGADLSIALTGSVIGIMDSAMAAKIISSGGSRKEIAETAERFEALQNSVESAAARGYVDQITEASELRRYLIGAVEMLYTKREELPARKHSAK